MDISNSFWDKSLHEPTRFKVNTDYFAPEDLELFVESLEFIALYTRKKQEREQRKIKANISKKHTSCLSRKSSSSTLSLGLTDEEEKEMNIKESKKLLKSGDEEKSDEDDETYFSAPNSAQTTPRNSAFIKQNKLGQSTFSVLTNSDSEESGFYGCLEPRSNSNSPSSLQLHRSPSSASRTRLFNKLKKKEEKSSKPPTVQLITCRVFDEDEILDVYEQQNQQMLEAASQLPTIKESRFSTLRRKRRQGFPVSKDTSEEGFLSKALRYLTL